MRPMLALATLVACTAAAPPTTPPDRQAADPSVFEIGRDDMPGERICRDTIVKAREERGLPKLDGQTADPDKPYFIAAVDKRIDGCSVMVMRNDTSDFRPLPKAGPALGIPALQ